MNKLLFKINVRPVESQHFTLAQAGIQHGHGGELPAIAVKTQLYELAVGALHFQRLIVGGFPGHFRLARRNREIALRDNASRDLDCTDGQSVDAHDAFIVGGQDPARCR